MGWDLSFRPLIGYILSQSYVIYCPQKYWKNYNTGTNSERCNQHIVHRKWYRHGRVIGCCCFHQRVYKVFFQVSSNRSSRVLTSSWFKREDSSGLFLNIFSDQSVSRNRCARNNYLENRPRFSRGLRRWYVYMPLGRYKRWISCTHIKLFTTICRRTLSVFYFQTGAMW